MNMDILFTNYSEQAAFTDAIAHRRIKELEETNSSFDEEIAQTIEICDEIFKNYGSETNFITEIIDLEMRMQNAESQKLTSVDIGDLTLRRESLYNKYNSFLEKLPLEIKEDLEFYYKKISDRKLRLSHTLDKVNQIESEYPKAEGLTVSEIWEQPIFQKIDEFLSGKQLVNPPEIVDETSNLAYVLQIKKAPDDLLNMAIGSNQHNEEPEKEEESLEIPDLFLENDVEYQDELSKVTPEFPDLPVYGTDKIDVKDEIEDPQDLVNSDNLSFIPFADFPKEDNNNLEVKEIEEEPVDDRLTYTMENGDTLTSLAIALCEDENGWYDIFAANKEVLEQRLQEAGLSNNDPFENNEEIFTGLTLKIPNVYEKANKNLGLAA